MFPYLKLLLLVYLADHRFGLASIGYFIWHELKTPALDPFSITLDMLDVCDRLAINLGFSCCIDMLPLGSCHCKERQAEVQVRKEIHRSTIACGQAFQSGETVPIIQTIFGDG